MEIFNCISSLITAIATVALAVFAFQARNSFLKQELYNFGWNFIQEFQIFKEWFLSNKKLLDEELTLQETKLAEECDNRFAVIRKSFLRLRIMTDEKYFKKTKEQIDKLDNICFQYYSKEINDDSNNLRDNICLELVKNNVVITEFFRFCTF